MVFVGTGYVLTSTLVSLVGVPKELSSSEVGLKICLIIAGIEKYKLIIEKKKNLDKIV